MGLDIADLGRGDPGIVQRLPDHRLLGQTVGRGETVAAPILVDRGPGQHRPNRIAGPDGIGQPFEQDHAGPFAAHIAIGASVKGFAATIACHHPSLGKGDGDGRAEDHVDAAHQGLLTLTPTQALTRLVDSHQGGRASGVNG